MILYVVRSQRPLQYVRVISDVVMQQRGYGFWFTDDVLADASTESYVVDGGELSDYKGQFLFRHLVPACKEPKEPFGGRAYFEVLVPGNDFEPPQMISRTYLNWHDFFTAGVPSKVLDRFQQSAAGVTWSGPARLSHCPSLSTPSHAQGWGLCGGLVPVELRACRTHVGPPPSPRTRRYVVDAGVKLGISAEDCRKVSYASILPCVANYHQNGKKATTLLIMQSYNDSHITKLFDKRCTFNSPLSICGCASLPPLSGPRHAPRHPPNLPPTSPCTSPFSPPNSLLRPVAGASGTRSRVST